MSTTQTSVPWRVVQAEGWYLDRCAIYSSHPNEADANRAAAAIGRKAQVIFSERGPDGHYQDGDNGYIDRVNVEQRHI